jgi:hypothetical protein
MWEARCSVFSGPSGLFGLIRRAVRSSIHILHCFDLAPDAV